MNLETHPVEVHKNPLTQEETNRMVELSQRISALEEALLKKDYVSKIFDTVMKGGNAEEVERLRGDCLRDRAEVEEANKQLRELADRWKAGEARV